MIGKLEYFIRIVQLLYYIIPNLTIKPHTPFNTKAGSYLCVNEHRRSIAPDSKIGSFDGENSSNKLHKVEEATTRKSQLLAGEPRIFINGFQTG